MSDDTEPEITNKPEGEKPAETETPDEKAPAAEITEVNAKEGEDAEDQEEKPEPKPEEKHKRQGGWQRKIDKLERENEALRELAVRGQKPPDPKEKSAEEKTAEYLDGLVEQRVAAREAQRDFQRRTAEVRAKHPDWDEAVSTLDIPMQSAVGQAILTSDRGPEIMYLLATDEAALARLRALPALAAAVEIGRLEAKLASSTAAPQANPTLKPLPRKSPAPAPITPVTARGPTTVKAVKDMTFEEYDAWRDSQAKR